MVRNTTYLTLASIFQKILSFVYFAILARSIGTEEIGAYSFALKFVAIFGIFIDLGLGPFLTREVARDEQKTNEYFSVVLAIKSVFAVISFVALFVVFQGILQFREFSLEEQYMVYIAGIIVVLDSFTFTFYSLFRAWQKIHFEALGVVLYQVLIVSFGFLFIFLHAPTLFFIVTILIGSTFNFLYSLFLLIRKGGIFPKLRFDFAVAKKMLFISFPFALAGIFYQLNNSLDLNFLRILTGNKGYAGWYANASKLVAALTVLPGSLATSFFPVMSRLYRVNKQDLARVFEKAMFYLGMMALPITMGIMVTGKSIVLSIFGKAWEASADSLYIFAIGIIFVFLNYPVGNLLNACNRQMRNTIHMGIALLVNIILNLLLIPRTDRFGTYIGATIASVVSSMVLVGLGLGVAGKIVDYNRRFIIEKMLRVFASSLAMAGCVWALKPYLHILILIALAPVFYLGFLILTRTMSWDEMKSLGRSVLRKVK